MTSRRKLKNFIKGHTPLLLLSFSFLFLFAGCGVSNSEQILEQNINNFLKKSVIGINWEKQMANIQVRSSYKNDLYFGILNFYNYAFNGNKAFSNYQWGIDKYPTDYGQTLLSSKIIDSTKDGYYVLVYTQDTCDTRITSPNYVFINKAINEYKIINFNKQFDDIDNTLNYFYIKIVENANDYFISNIKQISINTLCLNSKWSTYLNICYYPNSIDNLEQNISESYGFIDSISDDFIFSTDPNKFNGSVDISFFFSDKVDNIRLKSTWRFYFNQTNKLGYKYKFLREHVIYPK